MFLESRSSLPKKIVFLSPFSQQSSNVSWERGGRGGVLKAFGGPHGLGYMSSHHIGLHGCSRTHFAQKKGFGKIEFLKIFMCL